ncbi:MAG: response regulator transcription factor [Cyanobacteria bacterium SZAS TMP-1]|nr:response regulator transcription factor [Cyanobacteria bacterium SZAS TMP-1]
MAKVLVIDDDAELCRTVKGGLEASAWVVELAYLAKDGTQLLQAFVYDVIVLDWYLPDSTGLQICRDFRSRGGNTPILFLTGAQDINHKSAGFEAGGDDYLVKPFDLRELDIRLRALLRRPVQLSHELNYKSFELDCKLRSIKFQGIEVRLSLTEFSLIQLLFRYPDQLFSSKQLFERIWPSDTDSQDGTVRVHMHSLRRKMETAGMPEIIRTVRGSGYLLHYDG